MSVIYSTNSWSGYGKHSSYHNEYVDDGTTVKKVKVHEFKTFDGRENTWKRTEKLLDSWTHDDPSMPEWLREKLR